MALTATLLLALRWLGPLEAAQPMAGDSLAISGLVFNHTGARQPGARVLLVRHSPPATRVAWLVAATWTDRRSEFKLRIAPAEAADSLFLQVSCAARPRNISYVWGAVLPVVPGQQRLYSIQLQKRRIYPKIR